MPTKTVTRFAPSPTGYLHLGHAFSAIVNKELVEARGGRFLLRIEDIDLGRCRPAFETAIAEDLRWLGLAWDGEVIRQSERFDLYQEQLDRLRDAGLLYRCFKTRAMLTALAAAPHGEHPPGPLTAPLPRADEQRLLDEGRPFAWRLSINRAVERLGRDGLTWTEENESGDVLTHTARLSSLPDEILARKDFPASYHLASVADDAAQGVSLVCRGEDLRPSIPIQRLLQDLLALPAPVYRHHRLIVDEHGRRLAKRDRDLTLMAMRKAGATPHDIRRQLFGALDRG